MRLLRFAIVLATTAAAVRVNEPTLWSPCRAAPVHPPRRHVLAAGAAAALVARPPPAHALSDEQRLVGDVWSQVNAQFFDDTFNGLGADGWDLGYRASSEEQDHSYPTCTPPCP